MKARTNVIRSSSLLLGIVVGVAGARSGALAAGAETGSAPATGRWNIMVVPATSTAYCGEARELFDRHCASCHSRDGRAQTPIARQCHVQDLSECTLADDKIVEQILEGTHNKKTGFKMPPFKEKLTRAQIESLVPLVKGFRPVSIPAKSGLGAYPSEGPRLAGIVTFPGRKYAVLEKVPRSEHYFLLAERESHDGITLGRIHSKSGSVKLWKPGTKSMVTVKMDRPLTQPSGAHAPGFFLRLAEGFADTRHEVVLEQAGTDLVLFLYAQFTGRTLLRSPRLPAACFTLNAAADRPDDLARSLGEALAEKGITAISDGEKFLLVVPTSEAATARPLSCGIKSSPAQMGRLELFPRGAIINFANTDLSEVVKLYARLSGKVLAPDLSFAAGRSVNLTTQTPLSREECLYTFETLLAWHGLAIKPVNADSLRVEPR